MHSEKLLNTFNEIYHGVTKNNFFSDIVPNRFEMKYLIKKRMYNESIIYD